MTATNNIVKPYRVKDFVHTPKMDKGETQRLYRETSHDLTVYQLQRDDKIDPDEVRRMESLKSFYRAQLSHWNN